MFWLTCIVLPTTFISSSLLYLIENDFNNFPSIFSMLAYKGTKKFFKYGLVFGLITMSCSHKAIHNFYHKLLKRNEKNEKAKNIISVFNYVIDFIMVFTDVSFLGIIFVDFNKHKVLHTFCTISFFCCSLIFHFGIDELLSSLRRTLPISNSFNKLALVITAISGILFFFSEKKPLIYSIASFFEIVSLVLIFFKYIFVAMTVLGASFLPRRIFSVEEIENSPKRRISSEFSP